MQPRSQALANVIDAAREILTARVERETPCGGVATHIFDALAASAGTTDSDTSDRPAACRFLAPALERACRASSVRSLAEAFRALEPELRWRRRPGSEAHGRTFHDGHANSDIIGPTGLERRSDLLIGASLVAPNVRYIDHRHPPEEVYIVMSDGEWYREGDGWRTPRVGGIVYNPPNVVHAMRAGPEPLLAIWLLWVG